MPTTRGQQAQRTRRTVLDTARRLFAEHGYDATSLQQIADAMGVTKANVYYYFRTKAAILQALLEPMADALGELLDAAEAIEDGDARLAHVVHGFVAQVVAAHRTFGPLNLGDPGMRRQIEVTRTLDGLAERGLRILYGERPSPEQRAGYWLVNDLAPALRHLDQLPDDELRATLTRLCLRVLGGAADGPPISGDRSADQPPPARTG